MFKSVFCCLSIFTFLVLISNISYAGSISGVVTWKGQAPKLKPIKMDSDPACLAKYKGKEPPTSQALVLGPENTMGNIIVFIKSGLAEDKKYDPPAEPLIINQIGCNYSPHVFALMKKQKIKFQNSDAIQHNVHALPKKNRQFNISMAKNVAMSKAKNFKESEDVFAVKCDIHPWMKAYVKVLDHPFFAVTAEDGQFLIKDLPAGDYELAAWHEKLGESTAKLTVAADGTVKKDFVFSKK